MTASQGLLYGVLLLEGIRVSAARVSEDEASFVEDRDLVGIIKLPALVATDVCVIDVSAITGEIFQDSDSVALLVLTEKQAVSVTDRRLADDAIYVGSSQRVLRRIVNRRKFTYRTQDAVL